MNQKTGRRTAKKNAANPPESSPWPKRLAALTGGAVVLGLVAAVLFSSTPVRGVPEGTQLLEVAPPAHVEGDLHEGSEIPAGGAHSAVWQDCGFYDYEVRSENAVHSLEHGAVWITYRSDASTNLIDRLKRFVRPNEKVLVSVVPAQTVPVVATAWAAQLELTDANDARLEQFVNEFTRGRTAPEPGGACAGGIGGGA